ncbi:MAG: hypothetical protein DRG33_00490 [Deltaproteobacteria bacterium]|nr:MAG: hypothetical protein DRG33_00490 [Deltaproteobacteria bacterium]
MDGIESQILINAIAKAKENKLFADIEKVRSELRQHQTLLQKLADALAPYFEYLTLVANKKTNENVINENACLLYEQGQDRENTIEGVRNNQILDNFTRNPDVISFEKWAEQVKINRQEATKLIKLMKTGFDYKVGEKLGRNDDISLRVEKYMENYETILRAVQEIKLLISLRNRDNSNTSEYEDIYHLDSLAEWDDAYLNKKVEGIIAHAELANERQDALNAYNKWYTNLLALDVPEMQNPDVGTWGIFDDSLENMIFDNEQYGIKQEVDYLNNALRAYKIEYDEITPKPKYDLLDNLMDELLIKGKEEIFRLDKKEKEIRGILESLNNELEKNKDLEKKIRFTTKPAFASIKRLFIEQHRLDPRNENFPALLETYKRKKNKKGLFSFLSK